MSQVWGEAGVFATARAASGRGGEPRLRDGHARVPGDMGGDVEPAVAARVKFGGEVWVRGAGV